MIGEAIAKKVILDQIRHIFGPSLVHIVSNIVEQMFQISCLYHRNTSIGGV